MAISINSRHVALFTDAGYLWLGSADLRTKYCEIDTNFVRRPKQLVWCVGRNSDFIFIMNLKLTLGVEQKR